MIENIKTLFSEKQLLVLNWWATSSYYKHCDAIICDGAIRSGKTFCMSISFILWAQKNFYNQAFAICGKTIQSAIRNIVVPILPKLKFWGINCKFNTSKNYIDIYKSNKFNRFYIFGGKDEAAADFVQGITLAGVLFDEVVLLPEYFVAQTIARCSVINSKFWFNCNPQSPHHWFFIQWIKNQDNKNILYLHFSMRDNPSLNDEIINRYENLYSGFFYDRFVKGLWVGLDDLVYSMFNEDEHVINNLPNSFEDYYVSCDYGIINPMSFGLWGKSSNIWYRVDEYYHDSKKYGIMKTDAEYYDDLVKFVNNRKISAIIVDPSASSFIECIKRGNVFRVIKAQNDIMLGIRLVIEAIKNKKILIFSSCKNSIAEFNCYKWDNKLNKDAPKKQNDHAMDEIRYFVATILDERAKIQNDNFIAISVKRANDF